MNFKKRLNWVTIENPSSDSTPSIYSIEICVYSFLDILAIRAMSYRLAMNTPTYLHIFMNEYNRFCSVLISAVLHFLLKYSTIIYSRIEKKKKKTAQNYVD